MKNQNKKQIRLSVSEAIAIIHDLKAARASSVQQLAACRHSQLTECYPVWERDIAEKDALIASIEAQL